jgi:hypothetical protein
MSSEFSPADVSATFGETEEIVRLISISCGFQILVAIARCDNHVDFVAANRYVELVRPIFNAIDRIHMAQAPPRSIRVEAADLCYPLMRVLAI